MDVLQKDNLCVRIVESGLISASEPTADLNYLVKM